MIERKYPTMDEIVENILERIGCGFDELSDRQRENVYNEAWDCLCNMERHNC